MELRRAVRSHLSYRCSAPTALRPYSSCNPSMTRRGANPLRLHAGPAVGRYACSSATWRPARCCSRDSMPEAQAISVIAGLLRHLNRLPAPPILRRLDDIANRIVADAPAILPRAVDDKERSLLTTCTARLAELITEPVAGRLLHWDLHYDNVLARPGDRDMWVAIDPKPLAGDPGFELLPALWNRWAEVSATGDIRRALLRRFDLMIEVQSLDGERAAVWTLARVLQNALWDIGRLTQTRLNPTHRWIAETLLSRYRH